MKKILFIIPMIILTLSSCISDEEAIQESTNKQLLQIKQCDSLWLKHRPSIAYYNEIDCVDNNKLINECIDKYIDWIDEKYNNPDTVSNLREDNYSQVVKTCNEIFGNISITK